MKKYIIIFSCLILFCRCVTEYKAPNIEEMTDILVVEGIITDDESTITLSRSINLTEEEYWTPVYVDNANVYVECDDGTQWGAENYYNNDGQYTIKTGKLNPERKYCLKIKIDTYEYISDFLHPIKTPEIDSVFWIKRGQGQPIMMHVATHSPNNEVLYYRWSYKEDWEMRPEYILRGYPQQCWSSANSKEILLGSAERTVFGQLTDKIFESPSRDKRWSVLYRITLKQNAISKRAYNYFANIKKNAGNMGSIFAPIPSELRGNITCITDPSRPVIGYVEVSSTTQIIRYISKSDNLYESYLDCKLYDRATLMALFGEVPESYINVDGSYINLVCVECNGTMQKPDDWPNN